jgi:ribosomal protein S18 acetylase RimI-like enzyme
VSSFLRPELLRSDHEVADFDCGSEAQTTWLRRHALQAQQADSARVYVVCRSATRQVVGYYAIAAGSVAHDSASPRVAKGLGRYPIPVVVLTRLGVDMAEQGRGLGLNLVRDALLQTAAIGERVAVRALVIHAETPRAASFYRRISPAFEESPTDPLHLILLLKDLRSALREAANPDVSRG